MSEPTPTLIRRGRWRAGFTRAAIASVLFMLLGVLMYVEHVTLDAATLPVDQRAAFLAEPQWVTAVFAVATWTGLAGAILLALRRQTAVPVILVVDGRVGRVDRRPRDRRRRALVDVGQRLGGADRHRGAGVDDLLVRAPFAAARVAALTLRYSLPNP